MPNKFQLANFPNFEIEFNAIKGVYGPNVKLFPVGSYETSDGVFRDINILCYVEPDFVDMNVFRRYLQDGDWVTDNRGYPVDGNFLSFRGMYDGHTFNLIVSNNVDFVSRFLKAANLCKTLNLTNKNHRVLVHNMFRSQVLARNIWEIEV